MPPASPFLALPLEIRLLILQHALPRTAEADCCADSLTTPTSPSSLPSNPLYPGPQLTPFAYPTPHTPLRRVNRQLNTEILVHVPLPLLTARVCHFLCLRRALATLSFSSSFSSSSAESSITPKPTPVIHPRHISLVKITRLHAKITTTTTTTTTTDKDPSPARTGRLLARSFEGELRKHFRHVRYAETTVVVVEEGMGEMGEMGQMSFEVGRPLRRVVVGDSGGVVGVR